MEGDVFSGSRRTRRPGRSSCQSSSVSGICLGIGCTGVGAVGFIALAGVRGERSPAGDGRTLLFVSPS